MLEEIEKLVREIAGDEVYFLEREFQVRDDVMDEITVCAVMCPMDIVYIMDVEERWIPLTGYECYLPRLLQSLLAHKRILSNQNDSMWGLN